MSKKSFTEAPKPKQPSAEQIEAFERGGSGHDTGDVAGPVKAHISTNVGKDKKGEPTKRLSLDLPASTHRRFKTACSATGRKMAQELEAFIERRISELEAEGGISHN